MGASNQLLRLTNASYLDGLSQMNTGADPVAISRMVFDQDGEMPNELRASDLFITWGQFVDHDLSLTPDASGEMIFSPGLARPISRSNFDPETGIDSPREQVNVITPEMDASMVYGSDAEREAMLRSFEGGKLLMNDEGMMPLAMESGTMAGTEPDDPLYLAGDVRANENTGLTTLHTLFVREHNYWADRLSTANPEWSDQQVFDAARSIVEAEIQKITYKDWLPKLIGDTVTVNGYDANVDGRISTEFSTAGFRFGHTLVSPLVERVEENGDVSANGHISVMQAFFNNEPMNQDGIASILRGLSGSTAQASDAKMIDDLNMFLETPDGVSGFSLAALNVLRGRDHGLGTYVEVRAALLGDIDPNTLDPNDFSIITNNAETIAELKSVYSSVLEVDLWVGGLAEDNIPGTQLGALFTHIVADQFTRTAAADQSFGVLAETVGAEIAAEIANTTLATIITRNTDATYLQENVFVAANRIGGDDGRDKLRGTSDDDLILGFGGRDKLYGRDGDDTIFGGTGHDRIQGDNGNDALYGEDGRDKIYGGRGDDKIDGGAGRDRLFGHSGDDEIYGGDDRDYLSGGSGDDRLDGGAGNDVLYGGRGNDIFVFAAGTGHDQVKGFGYGDDVIDVSDFGITSFEELESHISRKGFSAYISIGEDSMSLNWYSPWRLDEDDFAYA